MSFNFLALPPEIRNRVYDELLVPTTVDDRDSRYGPDGRGFIIIQTRHPYFDAGCSAWHYNPLRRLLLDVAILRTSKGVSGEAAHRLYSRNRFLLCTSYRGLTPFEFPTFDPFISQIGTHNAASLGHVLLLLGMSIQPISSRLVLVTGSEQVLRSLGDWCPGLFKLEAWAVINYWTYTVGLYGNTRMDEKTCIRLVTQALSRGSAPLLTNISLKRVMIKSAFRRFAAQRWTADASRRGDDSLVEQSVDMEIKLEDILPEENDVAGRLQLADGSNSLQR